MKIYIASSSANASLVADLVLIAQSLGHEITFDWTPMVLEHGRGEPGNAINEQAAELDADGAKECETLILIDAPEMYGAMVELGIAISRATEVWHVVAEGQEPHRYSIFFDHPTVDRITYEEMRMRLVDRACT